jgi:transcriptional regulator with XRE-family HTH domain
MSPMSLCVTFANDSNRMDQPRQEGRLMASQEWWQRLRRDREARGLSQAQAVREFIAHADHHVPEDFESVLTAWKRWERGAIKGVPAKENQQAIAAMFGTAVAAYFGPSRPVESPPRLSDDETLELVQRLRASSVDPATLELAQVMTDRLCTDYASRPGAEVLDEAQRWLGEIASLKDKPMRYQQLGEVYTLAGWLSLLVACLQYDQGDERAAESARAGAVMLATEIGHGEILGWAQEIRAWMALTRGDYYGVLEAAKAGMRETREHSVAVQLEAQSAKAWARLGRRREVELALDRGRALLDRMDYPTNPRNHFQVDPAKFDFYAMDCYRAVGDDALAMAMADAVTATSTSPGGEVISPMRLSEAELTKATVLARAGEVDEATSAAEAGLVGDRRSLPSLLMVGSEVANELRRLHPHSDSALEFSHHIYRLGHPDDNAKRG